MSKEITIPVPDGKRAEWINGVLTLVDEPKEENRPVTERIKTLADAMEALGQRNPLVEEYIAVRDKLRTDAGELIAYLKLRIIVAALNEGWEPKFDGDECSYYPWFDIYTKAEYERIEENNKEECIVFGCSGNNANANGGVVCVCVSYISACYGADSSFRLALKTRELAEYCGKQFIKEWVDFVFNPLTGGGVKRKVISSQNHHRFHKVIWLTDD